MSRYELRPRQSESIPDDEPVFNPDPIDDEDFDFYLSNYLDYKKNKKLEKLKIPTNPNDLPPAGADIPIKTQITIEEPKYERRKRKNKNRAEKQFDVKAKPKDIKSFIAEVKIEEEFKKFESIDEAEQSIEIQPVDLTPVQHEEMAIAELIVAKHNSTDQVSEQYGLDLIFNNQTEIDYIDSLDITLEPFDLDDNKVKVPFEINDREYNNELFVQRRLFGCIQHLVYSDPQLLKKHMPVKNHIELVDNSKLFSDDENSLNILKERLKNNIKEFNSFKDLIKNDKIQFKIVDQFLKCRNNGLICLLASIVLIFDNPKLLANRNLKVKDINPRFKDFKIKDVSISAMFNRIGIGFFSDYCLFSKISVHVANLVHSRHKNRMKDLRKLMKNKKIKIVHDHSNQPDFINLNEQ